MSDTVTVGFDPVLFVKTLRDKALPPYGAGKCALHVRWAIEAAGIRSEGHPVSAKDYGPFLVRRGFSPVTDETRKAGDIAVIQSTSASRHGHIEGYDGTQWISDFVQREFWPGATYRSERPAFVVYRFGPAPAGE